MLRGAHRGASAFEPENTLRAFQVALENGANIIEFDVRATKDKKIVVIHDPTLERTTNGKGKVSEYTLKELRKFRIGEDNKIPTLHEALKVLRKKCHVFLEIKDKGIEQEVLRAVKNTKTRTQVSIISFKLSILRKIRALDPTIPIGIDFTQIVNKIPFFIPFCKFSNIQWLVGHYHSVDSRLIKKAHKWGLLVAAWGPLNRNSFVDTPSGVKRFENLNLDALLVTNPAVFDRISSSKDKIKLISVIKTIPHQVQGIISLPLRIASIFL